MRMGSQVAYVTGLQFPYFLEVKMAPKKATMEKSTFKRAGFKFLADFYTTSIKYAKIKNWFLYFHVCFIVDTRVHVTSGHSKFNWGSA